MVMSVGVGELTAATNEMTGKVTAGQSEAWKLSTRRPLYVSIAVGGGWVVILAVNYIFLHLLCPMLLDPLADLTPPLKR